MNTENCSSCCSQMGNNEPNIYHTMLIVYILGIMPGIVNDLSIRCAPSREIPAWNFQARSELDKEMSCDALEPI